jgi:hypothetical protein
MAATIVIAVNTPTMLMRPFRDTAKTSGTRFTL